MIRVREVKVNFENSSMDKIKEKTAKKLNIDASDIDDIKIIKESLDARNKKDIKYVYEVEINTNKEKSLFKNKYVYIPEDEDYKINITGKNIMKKRPIIVGSGPAGLFCAYMLSLYGYKPVIIERGKRVEERIKDVEDFWKNNKLNKNSNVQFGEGGAGTFSDGKLNTLVKDKYNIMKKVFEIFVECGADPEILYKNKPHIGTDILRNVIINMRNKIISNGGEFRYNTCLTNLVINDDKISKIQVNNDEFIECDDLILAIGHSARDTFKMLNDNNINMMHKPFAVGIRVQHPQTMINKSQYGYENNDKLPVSDYKLTYTAKDGRGVYSFCMCPGGYVVNASSEEGGLAINGMSNHKRDSENANSAIVVQVTSKDFGNDLFDGIKLQKKLEKLSYEEGNGLIPVQLFKDFKDNKKSTSFGSVKPVFKGNYRFANLNNIFPKYIVDDLIEAIEYFGEKIDGFNKDDVIISAVESRTSSPIRIIRDDNFMTNIKGIYPVGEGAGYSGGITTSAMDGIRAFEKIIKKYKKSK